MGIFYYINPVNWFRAEQRFDTSAEFEGAVNHALTADTIADATRKPYISEEGALNLSAVWACVRILSDTVGTLPIHLYKRTDKGRERQYTHPCHRLLQLPNSFSNRFDLMHHLMTSCALWGNGYARIFRDNKHRPVRLQLLHPARVEPVLTTNDELFYKLDTGELIANDDMIHLKGLSTNGIKGKSPIAVHRDNLSLTMAAQLYGEKFFNQGGNMSGVFKYPSTLKPEAYQRLKKDLMAQSVGLEKPTQAAPSVPIQTAPPLPIEIAPFAPIETDPFAPIETDPIKEFLFLAYSLYNDYLLC